MHRRHEGKRSRGVEAKDGAHIDVVGSVVWRRLLAEEGGDAVLAQVAVANRLGVVQVGWQGLVSRQLGVCRTVHCDSPIARGQLSWRSVLRLSSPSEAERARLRHCCDGAASFLFAAERLGL